MPLSDVPGAVTFGRPRSSVPGAVRIYMPKMSIVSTGFGHAEDLRYTISERATVLEVARAASLTTTAAEANYRELRNNLNAQIKVSEDEDDKKKKKERLAEMDAELRLLKEDMEHANECVAWAEAAYQQR